MNNPVLPLLCIKTPSEGISLDFLGLLKDIYGSTVFIETGTYLAGTTVACSRIFNEVYSIELGKSFYLRAIENFGTIRNIKFLYGDSCEVLPALLQGFGQEKVLFWLDGHYSGGLTAKGSTNTPIFAELIAIRDSRIKDAVILIDDLRCFNELNKELPPDNECYGYPSFAELSSLILAINPAYQILVMGDVLLCLPPNPPLRASDTLSACTRSRGINEESGISLTEIFAIEAPICTCMGLEREAIKSFPEAFGVHSGAFFYYWAALAYFGERDYDSARHFFNKARELGFSSERIGHYQCHMS